MLLLLMHTVPQPPSNLTVTQSGIDTVSVSWTPSHGVESYRIYYTYNNERRSRTAKNTTNSVSIKLDDFRDYLFEILASTALNSPTVGPVLFTLGRLTTVVFESVPNRFPSSSGGLVVNVYLTPSPSDVREQNGQVVGVGEPYNISCNATVHGNLNGALEFSWTGPGELPDPVRISDIESQLQLNPLRRSQIGLYICTVSVEGFPYQFTEFVRLLADFFSMCNIMISLI